MTDSCLFVSIKTKERCGDKEILPFGFCSKHSKTVQAKNAKEAWKKSKDKVVVKEEEKKKEKETIEKDVKKLRISKNKYGRFVDVSTHIVFDPYSKVAYAVEGKEGKLLPLQEKHFNICEEKGWKCLGNNDYWSD